MADTEGSTQTATPGTGKRYVIFVLIVVLAFLAGFVPMWLRSRQDVQRLQAVQQELDLARIQIMLASAIVDARHGGYETARQSMSSFYSALAEEVKKEGSLASLQRKQLEPIFVQRDEIITLLARSDPSSPGRLSDLYLTLRDILGQQVNE